MSPDALVSTIIPVFNRPRLLREAVESVLAQTYRPIEILIVDDGSTDETPEVAEAMAAAHPEIIRTFRQENGGPGRAREIGRKQATGAFVQHLDSDDLLLPEKFARQVAALKADPGCSVAYGMTRFYRHDDQPVDQPWKRTGEAVETMFPSFLNERWWDTSTPLYRRSVIERAGPWLTTRNEEDWEYDCRIASQGVRLAFCPVFVSDTRAHPGEMLSSRGSSDPGKLADRAIAHQKVLAHAMAAGISRESPDMRRFSRKLFLLARQCAAAGVSDAAEILFCLSRDAAGPPRSLGKDYRLIGATRSVLGWRATGLLAAFADRVRNATTEPNTDQ